MAARQQHPPTTATPPVNGSDTEGETTSPLTERHFMIPIRDNHGHSERINLRVHPNYMPTMNGILRSKKFPFRSTNDIVRFAIDRVSRELERQAEIPSTMRHIDAIREVLTYEESNLEYLSIFESMARVTQALINSNSSGEATRIVAEIRHHVTLMPEGYWRQRYEQELLTRFGHLLRVTPGEGASLIDGDQSE